MPESLKKSNLRKTKPRSSRPLPPSSLNEDTKQDDAPLPAEQEVKPSSPEIKSAAPHGLQTNIGPHDLVKRATQFAKERRTKLVKSQKSTQEQQPNHLKITLQKLGQQGATLAKRAPALIWLPFKLLYREILRTPPRAIRRQLLLSLHDTIIDRPFDKYFFIGTSGRVKLKNLTIKSSHKKWGYAYKPTPSRVLDMALSMLPSDLSTFTFVDIGAGRGRTLLRAANYPFKAIRGAEFSNELHDDIVMNIAQYPRSLMTCRDVTCDNVTATRMTLPKGPTIFFVHRPFQDKILKRLLNNITLSYVRTPRPIFLVTVNFNAKNLVEEYEIFHQIIPTKKARLKQALLSPYPIQVFEAIY